MYACTHTPIHTWPTARAEDLRMAASAPYVETLPLGIALQACWQ